MSSVRSSRRIYEGRVLALRVDEVELASGHRTSYEVVEHSGGVAIVAQPTLRDVVLIRQYRPATGRSLWEVPAGKLERGEDPVDCARRELAEETGYRCSDMRRLWSFFTAPGFCSELIHLFVAEGIVAGTSAPEPSELIEVRAFGIDEAWRLVEKDEIPDAKTQIALAWLRSKDARE